MSSNLFSDKDLAQISLRGLTVHGVEGQIDNFRAGFPFLPVAAAATAGDGITVLSEEDVLNYAAGYDNLPDSVKTVKFVPASGAATRMFKELFEFLSDGKRSAAVERAVEHIADFAFAPFIDAGAGERAVVSQIIGKEGLNYGAQPKALILFHKYPEGPRTAAEEHLVEGAMYAASGGTAHIHFTVSGEHLDGFRSLFARTVKMFEERFGVRYDITFSQQKPSTDTIAVNEDNTPFREPDGSLLFRPAGHGALLENLADIDADIVFIKNIDNVAPDRLKGDTVKYKKALAGLLAELQGRSFDLQRRLRDGGDCLAEAETFVTDRLSFRLPEGFGQRSAEERRACLLRVLDRPMRVCGVVRNEGEPGGGPFWVAAKDGSRSLQIAESSQIAPEDMRLMSSATHFNPVDLVCAVKDSFGCKYDLGRYADPSTGFISEKSKDGRRLRAQELPGLWNGAMADWNTVLVEVPISTFSPVKVVTDLLRPQHQ